MRKLTSRLSERVDRWLGGSVIHDLVPYRRRLEAIARRGARAQRIVEGQNFEIRCTLWRYAEPMERHREIMETRRRDLLFELSGSRLATTDPELHAARAERVGGRDPLGEFLPRAADSFHRMQREIDDRVRDTLRTATIDENGLDLEQEGAARTVIDLDRRSPSTPARSWCCGG